MSRLHQFLVNASKSFLIDTGTTVRPRLSDPATPFSLNPAVEPGRVVFHDLFS